MFVEPKKKKIIGFIIFIKWNVYWKIISQCLKKVNNYMTATLISYIINIPNQFVLKTLINLYKCNHNSVNLLKK